MRIGPYVQRGSKFCFVVLVLVGVTDISQTALLSNFTMLSAYFFFNVEANFWVFNYFKLDTHFAFCLQDDPPIQKSILLASRDTFVPTKIVPKSKSGFSSAWFWARSFGGKKLLDKNGPKNTLCASPYYAVSYYYNMLSNRDFYISTNIILFPNVGFTRDIN
jgi:hypothetical protein